ncbi:acid-sensing ion channel 4-A-like, partial [Neopsephotus bourkii]|uniref:acid-sensing ion channel 4-A-like n=1 Tax=Neopsephotus bourkii TaxID=309878 RepID=UPI002AA514D5
MPIEIVCKIKFAEEDEKQKEKEEGDKESLIEEPARPRSRDLAAFASTSTLHGLGHICRSGRLGVRQTLWALAFLASLAFFLYQATKSALLYLEHPHVMALDEEATREMVFPAITICNINRYRHSALTDADIFHLANMTGLPPKDRDGHKATDLLYPDPDMADIVNRTGHQLDDMLKSCNFSGENCSSRDFTVVSAQLAQLHWGPCRCRGHAPGCASLEQGCSSLHLSEFPSKFHMERGKGCSVGALGGRDSPEPQQGSPAAPLKDVPPCVSCRRAMLEPLQTPARGGRAGLPLLLPSARRHTAWCLAEG